MSTTDPLSDLLTRIRNAFHAGHEALEVPSSKLKLEVAKVLAKEGYLSDVQQSAGEGFPTLTLTLRYMDGKKPGISEIKRISRPGRRVYVAVTEIPRVKNGLGVSILSTSKGILADRDARAQRLGGEVLCTVW